MIEVSDIRKSYIKDKVILNNISFNINPGEAFGILGNNGSGKTTLISIITGLIKADAGYVAINGIEVSQKNNYRELFSVVYQKNGIDFYLNIYENLKIHGMLNKLCGKELYKRIDYVMDMFDLKEYAKYKIRELSGGYARRLQCAKALMPDVPLYIFDEPTTGMDIVIKNIFFDKLCELKKNKKMIVFTTQQLNEVEKICDRILILKDGQIYALDNVINIKNSFSNYLTLKIQLLEINDLVLKELNHYLAKVNDKFTLDVDNNKCQIFLTATSTLESFMDILVFLQTNAKVQEFELVKSNLEDIMLNLNTIGGAQ